MLLDKFADYNVNKPVGKSVSRTTLLDSCMSSTGRNHNKKKDSNHADAIVYDEKLDNSSFECMKLIMEHPKFLEKYQVKESYGFISTKDPKNNYTHVLMQAIYNKKFQCARYLTDNKTSPEWCFSRMTQFGEIIDYAARNDSEILKLLFKMGNL